MDLLSIIILAIGLAMDCFAVSLSKGLVSGKYPQWWRAVVMAFFFGLFQGAMPLISFFAGSSLVEFFSRWSHWVALLILLFLGGKMIVESLRESEDDTQEKDIKVLTYGEIIILAISTSIDALASGVLFIHIPQTIWLAVSIIALVSLVFSLIGYSIGLMFGRKLRFNAELIGGVFLIGIGLKIFIEHYI